MNYQDLQLYVAALTLYENNFHVLHWKMAGKDFERAHKRFGNYYEELQDMLDEAAEQLLSLGGNPTNIVDSVKYLEASESFSATIVSAEQDYCSMTANKIGLVMFKQLHDIATSIATSTDGTYGDDVKDILIKHMDYYRLEGFYKLNRFLVEPEEIMSHQDDDDND